MSLLNITNIALRPRFDFRGCKNTPCQVSPPDVPRRNRKPVVPAFGLKIASLRCDVADM